MDLIERVKGILLNPDMEWRAIERESGDPNHLFPNYVSILALIPALASFIGSIIGGRVTVFTGFFTAIFLYVLTFVLVYVVGILIDALAPTFGAQKNFANALKLSVYSFTPVWLSGIFMLVPGLRFLMLLGLYGVYLLWIGLPPLMKAPQDRALLYAITAGSFALVVYVAFNALQGALPPIPR
jgi:hypothetical protein